MTWTRYECPQCHSYLEVEGTAEAGKCTKCGCKLEVKEAK